MAVYSTHIDNELVALLKQGDQLAYEEIYQRYVRKLTRFAEAKLYDLEEARDLMQDLFVMLWAERATLNIETGLEAYLFGTVRRQVINRIRKNVVRESYAAQLRNLSPAFHSLEEELDARELKANLRDRLDELPEKTRKIYQQSRDENKSIKEIAEEMQLSEQTVKNQISIAIRYLKKNILSIFFNLF